MPKPQSQPRTTLGILAFFWSIGKTNLYLVPFNASRCNSPFYSAVIIGLSVGGKPRRLLGRLQAAVGERPSHLARIEALSRLTNRIPQLAKLGGDASPNARGACRGGLNSLTLFTRPFVLATVTRSASTIARVSSPGGGRLRLGGLAASCLAFTA
jgi:hypothetical protein